MNILNVKEKRIKRNRGKIHGTAERPRLAVFRSLKHLSVQLIDDTKGVTLLSMSDKDTNNAEDFGKKLAEKAKAKKINEAVFDRRGYKYHGNIKSLADGARAGGLKI